MRNLRIVETGERVTLDDQEALDLVVAGKAVPDIDPRDEAPEPVAEA